MARKKTALYAPVLVGAATAAMLALGVPAMASPVTGQGATGTVSISSIFGNGDIVTGVRGTTDGNVIVTGSHATADGANTLPFLYQGPLTSRADDSGFHALMLALHDATDSEVQQGDREHRVPEPGDGTLRAAAGV